MLGQLYIVTKSWSAILGMELEQRTSQWGGLVARGVGGGLSWGLHVDVTLWQQQQQQQPRLVELFGGWWGVQLTSGAVH